MTDNAIVLEVETGYVFTLEKLAVSPFSFEVRLSRQLRLCSGLDRPLQKYPEYDLPLQGLASLVICI
jgi:hypothetical protein